MQIEKVAKSHGRVNGKIYPMKELMPRYHTYRQSDLIVAI